MIPTAEAHAAQGWAIVLGGSSGIGLAITKRLAKMGFSLVVVYREPKSQTARFGLELDRFREQGTQILEFKLDAASPAGCERVVTALLEDGAHRKVSVVIHSLARGNLKPLRVQKTQRDDATGTLSGQDLTLTVSAMGLSLLAWVQSIAKAELLAPDTRVVALTSEGARRVWPSYAAVSAAKAALEALVRSIAVEYGPVGVRCNAVQAGITDTPSLRRIPGAAALLTHAAEKNPLGRATQPDDVAQVVSLLCRPEAHWINGSVVVVDGGESAC